MKTLEPILRRVAWGSYADKPGWMVTGIRDASGKILRKFYANETDARRELARQRRLGESANKLRTGQIEDAAEALEMLKPYDKSLRDAARFYADHLKAMESTVPIKDMISSYIKRKRDGNRSPEHLRDITYRLNAFGAVFGDRPTASLTKTELTDWLLGLDLGPQSKRNFLRVIHGLLAFAVAEGKARSIPISLERRKNDLPKIVSDNPGVLKPEQFARLLEAADECLRPALAIQGFAGLRPAEVLRIHWSDVKLEEKTIVVDSKSSKTSRRRTVGISANLLAWLIASPTKTGPVAPSFMTVRRRMAEARQAAGITVWPHDCLRHSWVSYRFALTGDAARTAAEAGHSQTVLHGHYDALVSKSDAERWFAIVPGAVPLPLPIPFEPAAAQA
jgi:integrase